MERVNSRVLSERGESRGLTDVAEGGLLSERLPPSVERGVTERVTASETVRERSVGERLPPALPRVREPGVRGSSGAEGRRKSARESLSGTPVAAREGEGRRRQEALRHARQRDRGYCKTLSERSYSSEERTELRDGRLHYQQD